MKVVPDPNSRTHWLVGDCDVYRQHSGDTLLAKCWVIGPPGSRIYESIIHSDYSDKGLRAVVKEARRLTAQEAKP